MKSYSLSFSLLLAVLVLQGAPVQSNSPHSPYTQLKTLKEDVDFLKNSLKEIQTENVASEVLLGENKRLAFKIEQLESENENLKSLLTNLDEVYKKQSQDSQDFQAQLQKIKLELSAFCQTTNEKLQDFSKQMKSSLINMNHKECIRHTIVAGESLGSIARLYKTTPDQILSANCLQDTRGLHVGDTILIPQDVFLE